MSDIKQRGGHRAMATRITKEIDLLLRATILDSSKLIAKVNSLKLHQAEIIAYDKVIQTPLEDDALLDDMQDAADVYQNIEEIMVKATGALATINAMNQQNNSVTKPQVIKLPVLQLPTFSGNPLDWQHFWDIFKSSVHDRTDLAGSQKFNYLNGQLRGEAIKLLEGFAPTDLHYNTAVKLLADTYGDKRIIIRSHLYTLFDLKCEGPKADLVSAFRAEFECHLRGLESLGTKVEEAGFVLVELLLRKLPDKIRDNINRTAKSHYWKLDDFRSAIDVEIKLLQSTSSEVSSSGSKSNYEKADSTPHKPKEKFNKNKGTKSGTSSVSNFNVTASKGTSENKANGRARFKRDTYKCKLCFDSHNIKESCSKYVTEQDRVNRVKELKVCKRCFNSEHGSSLCANIGHCGFCKEDSHHIIFCPKLFKPDTGVTISSATIHSNDDLGVALPIALISVLVKKHYFKMRTLFDQGAQRSFVLKSVVDRLGLKPIKQVKLCVQGFSSGIEQHVYDLVQFSVKTKFGKCVVEALVTEILPKNIHMPGIANAVLKLKKLGICVADPEIKCDVVTDVSLLIGSDQYFKFIEAYDKYENINVLKSTVGTMISGVLQSSMVHSKNNMIQAGLITIFNVNVWDKDSQFDDSLNLEALWSLDAIGIREVSHTSDEIEALISFDENLSYSGNKYTARLPWRNNHPALPTNYGIAKGRLASTIKRLEVKENYIHIYDSIIKDQLDRGFIEKVSSTDLVSPEAKLHYLSHHGVKKDSVTTPLRIVFDCSAGNPSLNDCLYPGPSLIPELAQVLLRFRLHAFACVGDIEKAFLMINLHKLDRDSTRFLWPVDPLKPAGPLQIYRFCVVLFGATCSPFLLNATIKHHLKVKQTELTDTMSRNLYVDNLQGTSASEKELVKYYEQARTVFGSASLNLREWATNSKMLRSLIAKEKDGIAENVDSVKVLGLKWDFMKDLISYPERQLQPIKYTKREVLSMAAQIFDPLGFLLPVTIRSRVFIQTLWKLRMDWDHEFDEEYKAEWDKICNDINLSIKLQIARQSVCTQSVQLHAFCDASTRAYGTVIYLVSDGQSNLTMAKARVAPIKTLTVPQLELTAAVVSARLVNYVQTTYANELRFTDITMWSDSQVVLHWLKSTKPLKSYVRNRVDEINKLLPQVKWRYVPTKDNPADYISRGIKASVFLDSKLWLHGPSWIVATDDWPQWSISDSIDENVLAGYAAVNSNNEETVRLNVLDTTRFGSLVKLLKVTILVFRFVKLLKKQPTLTSTSLDSHGISSEEWLHAENFWIGETQNESYHKEIQQLSTGSTNNINLNLITQLGLFLESGVIRCRGRLTNSNLDYESKFPILLPYDNNFSRLLVKYYHEKVCHQGVNYTCNLVRQRWWIPHLRNLVKSVISKCVICKKLNVLHYAKPPSPPLPGDRILEARPFSVIGIDYTGALNVRMGKEIIKVYVSLFTCALTRAVHLELVHSNSTEDFLRAFRRFVARRSLPSKIYSDNATCFVTANKHLKAIQDHPELCDQFNHRKTSWYFIPARAPWFGGFWERMIGIVKESIKKCLGQSLVSEDELRTILTEVESIVNDRPLTYVSDDLNDLTSLTPSELVLGYKLVSLPTPLEFLNDDDLVTHEILNKRQKRCGLILEKFWKRWQTEYLSTLRDRHKYQSQTSGARTKISVGEVVLIYEPNLVRSKWKLGLVIKLHQGPDLQIRSATVHTTTGDVTRSIYHLYPLEIMAPLEDDSEPDKKMTSIPVIRPRRKAAELARQAIAVQARL